MSRTNELRLYREAKAEIFNLNELDLLTDEEKASNATHVKAILAYNEGKCDGVKLRQMTAAAAAIAKRQQSRSATAVLKWTMLQKTLSLPTIPDNRINPDE